MDEFISEGFGEEFPWETSFQSNPSLSFKTQPSLNASVASSEHFNSRLGMK